MNKTKHVKDVQIAYIGGGSRGWAWGLMSDLALEENVSGTVKLYDINFDAAQQNEIIGNRLRGRDDVIGQWDYEAVGTLKEALTGADFVIISILPGTFLEMKSDVHTPEQYGVYQSVGDTVGPGGLVRALRTIPLFVEIASQIKEHAPNAWVINYTNPMSLCTRTLYEVFSEIKAIGCCHEVFGTQKLLAMMLEDMEGLENVQRSDIKVNVLGINHFTWLDRASYQNIDLFPLYQKFVDKYYLSGFEGKQAGNWMNDHFASAQRVKFDLFKKFGLIAAAGDRHLAEFMPNTWYLQSPQKVKEWKFGLTPVDWRIERGKELYEKGQRLANGAEDFVLRPTGEEGVQMIKALLGLGDITSNVNFPNRGQMGGVPQNAIVETNAVFSYNSVQPILSGELPTSINNMVNRHIHIQEMTLQAAINCDKELALLAFLQDPLLSSLSREEVEELFEKMLLNTKNYLSGREFETVKN
ncbi:alpha-glucosidase/alpha-galactosidase [Neobacillus cucumis]|uniref:family 4 glycosyl hydrolase n=1 Tax=Neobacillus cucumis TaxID=1740721 RepID=UPI00203E2FBC|nr:alpha-glucosidase/alpha-galactosidase [Neobacillus cucumis]MCM3728048.1 alpha-glucosidase/alpha-galactosidase [Neobacillus cucumis]